jgi:ABC-type sugar transport system ATPase subunit
MASITFSQVSKIYADGTRALADLDLEVKDGELMVLVGPSGCGKSTALRLLAGLDEPSTGEIGIGGRCVNALPPQARNIAMVFQNYALYPHMSVRGNLAFPLKMMKLPRPEIARRVESTAQLLELDGLLERRPAQLSGGQRQRVAMGRAIVREPSAFLMDEPLSNLDARLRVQIRADIAALQRRIGTTTLYVTHDQVEAMTLGHRVAVMNAGRLQQVDTPQAIYDRPANTFVAGFIGSPGMNLFPARLRGDGTAIEMLLGDATVRLPSTLVTACKDLEHHLDEAITGGLRPEAFRVEEQDNGAIQAAVTAIEALGHESLLHFPAPWAPGHTLVARVDARHPVQVGETIRLGIDPRRLYFFDNGGHAICPPRETS